MTKKNTSVPSTEEQILNAAKKVFIRKGFDGARMQEIADEAGINKALLHYYYRSKDKLFDAIFTEAFGQFLPKMSAVIAFEKNLFKFIEVFISAYIDMLSRNPHLPLFVLHEMSRDPSRFVKMMKQQGIKPEYIFRMIQNESKKGNIKKIKPQHLMANIIGMCVIPFAAKPLMMGVMFNYDEKAYDQFLKERKKEVCEFVINSIRKK